jgi:hypothetical protein
VRHISPPPPHPARATFEACAGTKQKPDLVKQLLAIGPLIEAAEADYKAKAPAAHLYQVAPATTVGLVDGVEVIRLYDGTFSRRGSRTRHIYDQIKSGAKHGMCPLCAQRPVSTLDHYLPKSKHPAYAVMPVNLIPACQDCNKAKLNRQAATEAEQTLHPYYDNIDNVTWLRAKLLEKSPPALTFYVDKPAQWSPAMQTRVETHFRTFALASLYGSHAAEELTNLKLSLIWVADAGGAVLLRRHLADLAKSRRAVSLNSWQLAMLEELSNSVWFCEYGVKLIP